MINTPLPATFYPKRSSFVKLLLGCMMFVAIGIWIGFTQNWIGWLGAGFFAIGIPVAIIQLMPGSSWLRIDKDGFTYAALFRSHYYRFDEVDRFYIVQMSYGGSKIRTMVGWDFVPSYDRSKNARAISKSIGASEAALPDLYGMKAEQLCDLLNAQLPTAIIDVSKMRSQ